MTRVAPLLLALGPALALGCGPEPRPVPPAQPTKLAAGHANPLPTPSAELPPAATGPAPPEASRSPAAQAPPSSDPPAEPPPLPEGTMVLHIGDSMAGALGIALNDELKRHKVKAMLRFKTASYIPNWAGGQELPLYLAQFKPDLVLITLGTNEVKMLDPTQRAPMIRKIVQRLQGAPCVWIAPPVWTVEKGMYQVIRENIAPCRYMDTEVVYPDMPRLSDKIHPTYGARGEWAKRVVAWLAKERRPTPERPWVLAPEP